MSESVGCIVTEEFHMAQDGMTSEQVIEKSIVIARSMGIRIIRGPLFSWSDGKPLPDACDCFGAVLVAHNKAFRDFPKGWLKELCVDILRKDTFWWWRFNYGFNQMSSLFVIRTQGFTGFEYIEEDDVSLRGMRLAKRIGL